MNSPAPKLLRSKLFWVGVLYFAQGFPFGIFFDVFPVHFRRQGVSLSEIGLISLLGLAWTLKFLWAPAIDHFRHHRRWMFVVDLAMGATLLAFAVHAGFGPWVWIAIGLFTLFSATNDIAIDGYTIELLDKKELGLANGLRIGFYRVGLLAAGFMLVLTKYVGWQMTYVIAAGLLALLGFVALGAPRERRLPRREISVHKEFHLLVTHPLAWGTIIALALGTLWLINRTTKWSSIIEGFWGYAAVIALIAFVPTLWRRAATPPDLAEGKELVRGPLFGALMEMLQRPGMIPVLLFVLIFKLGDAAMGLMVKPFWVDAGFSDSQIGLVSINVGIGLSIAGGIAGGWLTDRIGIFRALWILGIFQALSNLGYAYVAWKFPLHAAGIGIEQQVLMYAASGLESFTGGLGTAAFLAFLMAIVDRCHATTQYALLSSVFALSRSLAGFASGYGAEAMGFASYFLLTFLLSFPAYLLLPWVKAMLARVDGMGEGEKRHTSEERKAEQ